MFLRLFLVVFCLLFTQISSAQKESLGEFAIKEIFVDARFSVDEPYQGQFSVDQSLLSFSWFLDPGFSAVMTLGDFALINRPGFYKASSLSGLGLIESYVQWKGVYGYLRAGMLPISFGAEGMLRESQIYLQRSLFTQAKITPLRDMGFEYFVKSSGFFTSLAIHNGEGFEELDHRMFFTGNWGWTNDRNTTVGISGQTGTTKPDSTSGASFDFGGANLTKKVKWRTMSVFAHWTPNNWHVLMDYYLGETKQNKIVTPYRSAHFDLSYEFNSYMWHFRRDFIDPNTSLSDDRKDSTTVGFTINSLYKNSSLSLFAVFNDEEGPSKNDNRYYLTWKLNPATTQ